MKTEIITLDRSQRNRLLGRETDRDPKEKYLGIVGMYSFKDKEYYTAIYDFKGNRLGGNLSTSRKRRA
jgi:hypothetical protein